MDWRNDAGVVVGGGILGGATVGTVGGAGTNRPNSNKGVTNLILLIEKSQWNAAAQRAITHPHEVKQLVKLRKTTRSSGGGGGGGGSSSVQISNVKCKALHHACQKLRSVHTNIYSRRGGDDDNSGGICGDDSNEATAGSRRLVIEEDEYIEACKCILTLIQIHPEACKERESRHGCLPLHLAVFSMCATPPPPVPSSGGGGEAASSVRDGGKNHSRGNSLAGGKTSSQRPPVVSSRSVSAPGVNKPPQSQTQILNLNQRGHRVTTSNSSADFSMGNISTMIQEESEHQQALDEHQQRLEEAGEDVNRNSAGRNRNNNDSLEGKLLERMDDMEMILRDLEKECLHKSKKDKRGKLGGAVSPTAMGMSSGDSVMPATSVSTRGPKAKTTTTTKVMGVTQPMDALEEHSRETDSQCTPQFFESEQGQLHPVVEQASSFTETSFTAHAGNVAKFSSDNSVTTNKSVGSSSSSTSLPYEELQRRYLQINTQRREEYSIRVINALLDAWPRGVKTASEGGRLPLHMACFGKATVKVMETILTAYPDAARQRNADGFLPIHIAAHWGVSHPDIAPLLLRAYPDGAVGRNRWERTPIEEALGMAGENGREHQMSLVWALRRHPTYWIHNDIATMLLPRNVRSAPWRIVDVGGEVPGVGGPERRRVASSRIGSGGGAVDVDEVGSSDDESDSGG